MFWYFPQAAFSVGGIFVIVLRYNALMAHKALIGASLGAIVLAGGLGYYDYRLSKERADLRVEVTTLNQTLASTTKNLDEVTQNGRNLLEALDTEKQRSTFLKEQSDTFGAAVQKLSGTVFTLDKLTKTDPQLLAKYSKVYFLNENYTPVSLVQIPAASVWNGKEEYFHAQALAHLERLLTASKEAGAEVQIISAYRSFERQKDLKSKYKVTYGTGANTFSAEQGYSEHQLGTAVDFTTLALGAAFEKFDQTTSFMWLKEVAYKYGFILSYPKGNAYYIYEPWHWRYVGVELATKLHDEKKNFYDMDQRAINEYLVKIFD